MAASAKSDLVPAPPVRRARGSADRLVEAAETLFGRHGLDGVSLRQIGVAAGSSNNYAVQYHFGDAAGLVREILARRMAGVGARREALLARIVSENRQSDSRALLETFLLPLLEPVNSAGERSFARFIAALMNASTGIQHCRDLFHLTPSGADILAHLHAANAHVPHATLHERLRLISIMVCASVFNRLVPAVDDAHDLHLIHDVLDIAAAGLGVADRRPEQDASHMATQAAGQAAA